MTDRVNFEALVHQWQQRVPTAITKTDRRYLTDIVQAIGAKTPRLLGFILDEWRDFVREVLHSAAPNHRPTPAPTLRCLADHLSVAVRMCAERGVRLDPDEKVAA